jgi:hypothetical protein
VIYLMGMSHILPVLDACGVGGLKAQLGRISNDDAPGFIEWDLLPDSLPGPLQVANLYIRQVAPHWGATLAVQTSPTVVGMAPGFQQLLGSMSPAGGLNTLFTFIHGEEHIHLALRERPDPFDFHLPERPDLVLLPGRQVLPLAVVEKLVAHQLEKSRAILMAIRATQPELRVVNVVCPPTIRTERWDPGPAVTNPEQVEMTPLSVRLKVYLVYERLLRQACAECGIESLAPPPETVSEQGTLRDEFAGDSVHGNKHYGELVVRQMKALL